MTLSSRTPEAVILAAGMGTRLRPMTVEKPKPLVCVHGVPILHNALTALGQCGVRNATIVVGYRRELVQRSCGEEFAGVRLRYVHSPVFDRTGSAYSLWLARETLLKGDTLLLEGDVFFESALLTRLLHVPGDVAAIDSFDDTISGSAAFITNKGRVRELRMGQDANTIGQEPLYKTVNIYRFTAETLRERIVPALDALIDANQWNTYVEQCLARLLEDETWMLRGAFCQGVRWYEIDSQADLRCAESIFDGLRETPSLLEPALSTAST